MRSVKGRFFDRSDWLAFGLAAGVSFAVYALSLGPSVGLEDAGELVTAADGLGVPHPPGYPLWTLISWCLCRLFGWVTWQGYPNPAWAVALGSALAGAVAAGLTALLVSRSARDLAPVLRRSGGVVCGVSAALVFAFSPVMWSQAVIAEVYALGALFLAAVLVLLYRWLREPRAWVLAALGAVFGLGLTNYQVLLLGLVPMAAAVFLRRPRLGVTFLLAAVPLGLTGYLLTVGALPSAGILSTPGAPTVVRPLAGDGTFLPAPFWAYGALGAFLAVALVGIARRWLWVALPGLAGTAVMLGVTGYCYAATSVPEGFRGTLYGFGRAWGIHLAALAVLWALAWRFRRARRFAACVTAVQSVGLVLTQQGLLPGLTSPATGWFWWPVVWNLVMLALLAKLTLQGGRAALAILAAELGLAVYAYLPIAASFSPAMNWGYACTWEGFWRVVTRGQYAALEPSAFFSADYLRQLWDYLGDLWVQFSPAVLGLALLGAAVSVWAAVRRRGLWLRWTAALGGFFLVMSAVLIALANPTGDIQDGFVQKVKFISSHGIFVLWGGYGLAAVLAFCRSRRIRGLYVPACLLGALLPSVPLAANFLDGELVRRMGAAEQTGHDFGWQYGAYMLDGQRAIAAELSPDEEPLPDPFWPPPMAAGALFFGGTDPGRFVPTYMVHAAAFRPDIAVVTQNALADATYLQTVRELYGERLELPSEAEHTATLTDFFGEVTSGRREGVSGSFTEENGTMRISGTGAITALNGILSRRIVTGNPGIPVYVEESYPLAWMRGRLVPNGLATRLTASAEAAREALEANAVRDADFWDWLERRLISRDAYRRDFAAKKSFSKLRAVQASAYAAAGMTGAAERAFDGATALWPESPETVYRAVREVYGPTLRHREAVRRIRAVLRLDPRNAALRGLLAAEEARAADAEAFEALTRKVRAGQAVTADVCALARTAERLGLGQAALAYWGQVAEAPDLTAREAADGTSAAIRLDDAELAVRLLRRVPEPSWTLMSPADRMVCAGVALQAGDEERARGLARSALRADQRNPRLWLTAAALYEAIGEGPAAYAMVRRALACGGEPIVRADAALSALCLRLTERFGPRKGEMP